MLVIGFCIFLEEKKTVTKINTNTFCAVFSWGDPSSFCKGNSAFIKQMKKLPLKYRERF